MDNYAKTLILINSDEFTIEQRVQLFELIALKIEIDTIQGTADKAGISYNGVKKSKRFKKTMVGSQLMAINGVREDSLPF